MSGASWSVARFNGQDGNPAYVDLGQVAAIVGDPDPDALAGALVGAVVILASGRGIRVKEHPDAVFDQVHRYRTEPPPEKPSFKGMGETH